MSSSVAAKIVSEVTPPRSRTRAIGIVLVLLALAALALALWRWDAIRTLWQGPSIAEAAKDQRITQLQRDLDLTHSTLRQLEQRLSDNASAQRTLREDVLGVGERAALLEDAVNRLAEPQVAAAQMLRLDEAELLLVMARQRLDLANDRAAAVHAYTLANDVLAGLESPRFVSLRQTIAQELTALRALPEDPSDSAAGELDALEASLPLMTSQPFAVERSDTTPKWRDLLGRLVQVRRSDAQRLLAPDEQDAGQIALRLELALARTALERRDERAFRASLQRIAGWLTQLFPDSPVRNDRQQRLAALATQPLSLDLPVLGSTLEQLRLLRASTPSSRGTP